MSTELAMIEEVIKKNTALIETIHRLESEIERLERLDVRPPGCVCAFELLDRWGCDCGSIDDDGKFVYEDPENPYMFCDDCDCYHAISKRSCKKKRAS